MDLKDVFPPSGHLQTLHCDKCRKPMDLVYRDFNEHVSGVDIRIAGLPYLHCDACDAIYLPDDSRFAIIRLHEQAIEKGTPAVRWTRNKPNRQYNFTPIPFIYDSDDYNFLPGLYREHDVGFLTPVFFNKAVLLKYDSSPDYNVKFASTTYGTIDGPEYYISFGINKNGKVLMWLGDIAALPEAEQYYLRSENVPSDHSIGSEFYDGQIECIFTERSREDTLFNLRSAFLDRSFKRFKAKIAHLDVEVIDLAVSFNPPVIDTPRDRRHVADTLNKIYVESLDNRALAGILSAAGIEAGGTGTLKRLQALLQSLSKDADVAEMMSPFYVLYDFRVAASHLTSTATVEKMMKTVTERLALKQDASLAEIYTALTDRLKSSLERMIALVEAG